MLAALAAVFGIVASLFTPSPSGAREDEKAPPLIGGDGSVLLGQTLGRGNRLIARATSAGVRYTVTDSRGRTLAENLSAEDVYRSFPDLAPGALHLGPDDGGRAIMMVEDQAGR